MLLSFEGLSRPVALIDCDDLAADIAGVLRHWPFREKGRLDQEPVITIALTQAGYRRDSSWLAKPAIYKNRVDAVCDFIIDLVNAFIADDPQLLCLHCAAVDFGGGLVVFPNPYKAGKSTLAAHLVQSGARLFSDDVLPVRGPDNLGVALGVLPRLRLPLPGDTGEAFKGYVRQHSGPKSKKFLYLKQTEKQLAPFGTLAPIRGAVFLQRQQTDSPALAPIRQSEAIKEIIRRNFSRKMPALDILDRLQSVIGNAECFTLKYQNAAQAVDLLRGVFPIKNSLSSAKTTDAPDG